MFYHDLDDLPLDIKPEHLIVISSQDFENAKRTRQSGQFLLTNDKHFLVMPTKEEAINHPIIKPLYENSYLKENTILLLDKNAQNSNYYLPYNMIAEKNIEMQMLHLPLLCQHLGVKSVRVILNEKAQECRSMDIDIGANIKGANTNLGANYNSSQNNDEYKNLITEFDGNHIDLEEAEKLMKTGIFDGNTNIIQFYNTAKNQKNKMKSQKLRCKISQDISRQFDVFANTDIPLLKTIFNAEMKAQMQKIKSLEIEYEVIF